MRLYRKNERFPYLNTVLSVVVFGLIIGVFIYFIAGVSANSSSESKKITEEAIRKAMVSCYAIEGVYPPNIDYLEENYGVVIDHDLYLVDFQRVASNVMPSVMLIDKTSDQTGEYPL